MKRVILTGVALLCALWGMAQEAPKAQPVTPEQAAQLAQLARQAQAAADAAQRQLQQQQAANALVTASGAIGTLEWALNERDSVLVIGGVGAMPDFAPVVSLSPADTVSASPWLYCAGKVKKLIVMRGVENVGDYAFLNLPNLAQVRLPGTIIKIGRGAFANNRRLHDVDIPGGLQIAVSKTAFGGCPMLK